MSQCGGESQRKGDAWEGERERVLDGDIWEGLPVLTGFVDLSWCFMWAPSGKDLVCFKPSRVGGINL